MICERGSTYLNNFRKESVRDRLNLSGLTLLEAAKPKIGAAAKNHRVLLPDAAAPIISCQYHQLWPSERNFLIRILIKRIYILIKTGHQIYAS